MKQVWLTYAAIAAVILGAVVGSIAWSVTRAPKTKIVTKTKTRTVLKAARFDGTPISLARFLQTNGQQLTCPPSLPTPSSCFQFAGNRLYVYLAIPKSEQQQGMAG